MRDTIKTLLVMSAALLLVAAEAVQLPISGFLAVVILAATILHHHKSVALRLSAQYEKIWVAAEIMLFVLIGAAVDICYAMAVGLMAVLLLLVALAIRSAGVFACLICTPLTMRERIFCVIAYLPKATVQAAIGGIPLVMGVVAGDTILSVAVIAILVTAPLGAAAIDTTYKKLLTR